MPEPTNKKTFDPGTAFFDLPIVRNTFGVACIVVVFSFVMIALFTEAKISLDMKGFNGFIEMFKFPLGSIAFFGGIFAFYATNHRSEQQKRAMELSQKSIDATGEQNKFANYYKHLEEFQKYLNFAEGSQTVNYKLINKRRMHSSIFPKAEKGVLKLEAPKMKIYYDLICTFFRLLTRILQGNSITIEFRNEIAAHRILLLSIIGQVNILKDDNQPRQTIQSFISEMYNYLNELEFVYQVMSFDTTFDSDRLAQNSLLELRNGLEYCFKVHVGEINYAQASMYKDQTLARVSELKETESLLEQQLELYSDASN